MKANTDLFALKKKLTWPLDVHPDSGYYKIQQKWKMLQLEPCCCYRYCCYYYYVLLLLLTTI